MAIGGDRNFMREAAFSRTGRELGASRFTPKNAYAELALRWPTRRPAFAERDDESLATGLLHIELGIAGEASTPPVYDDKHDFSRESRCHAVAAHQTRRLHAEEDARQERRWRERY